MCERVWRGVGEGVGVWYLTHAQEPVWWKMPDLVPLMLSTFAGLHEVTGSSKGNNGFLKS